MPVSFHLGRWLGERRFPKDYDLLPGLGSNSGVLHLMMLDDSSRGMIPPEMVDTIWCCSEFSDLAIGICCIEMKWVEMVN
ncbi:hypothetical protein L195_g032612 [Trifolium pratense]|uniref:Uncharacterized protein n=1 Tax=Trifolium pratense TaxID=57577 RepID=A0A2K3LDR5_TRIPR|nr:hypothetical protein L195_g032612 [Trifolium pratense]